jgi:hypothetical protein|tara:strand:+ start:151 stop:333 length:183 start_codon:yes stop_codon:yes gene_type:complete
MKKMNEKFIPRYCLHDTKQTPFKVQFLESKEILIVLACEECEKILQEMKSLIVVERGVFE